MTSNPNDAYADWLEAVAAEARFGPKDKLGTSNYIDAADRTWPASPVTGFSLGASCLTFPRSGETEWADPAKPVSGEDIDSALAVAGVTFEPGDALLLYMGRDKYEAAGHEM